MFKKQRIYFDLYNYDLVAPKLEDFVNTLNIIYPTVKPIIDELNTYNKDEIYFLLDLNQAIRNKYFNKKYLEVCENDGLDASIVYNVYDAIRDLEMRKTSKQCKEMLDNIQKVRNICYRKFSWFIKCIYKDADNTFKVKDNLEEVFSYYTLNENQNKVLDAANNLVSVFKDIEGIINFRDLFYLIRNDYSIDLDKLYREVK